MADKAALRKMEFLRQLAGEIAQRLGGPSPALPSVRCLSKATLFAMFDEARDGLASATPHPKVSKTAILEFLQSVGLMRRIPTELGRKKRKSAELYLAQYGSDGDLDVDPLELMQAAVPHGVICYYSAMFFHGLTTQIPAHHHIAEVRDDAGNSGGREGAGAAGNGGKGGADASLGEGAGRSYSKLGVRIFDFGGVSFYFTMRDASLLRSFSWHQASPDAIVRVTSLEQTLLDSLHMPIRCGGPPVVMEAWGEAIDEGRIRQSKLASILREASNEKLARRVGCMFDELSEEVAPELAEVLDPVAHALEASRGDDELSLLPGYEANGYNRKWHTRMFR